MRHSTFIFFLVNQHPSTDFKQPTTQNKPDVPDQRFEAKGGGGGEGGAPSIPSASDATDVKCRHHVGYTSWDEDIASHSNFRQPLKLILPFSVENGLISCILLYFIHLLPNAVGVRVEC